MSIAWTTATNLINIGSSPNKGDGDSLRAAFTKINNNFVELFTATSTGTVATTISVGIVKPGAGLVISSDGTLSVTGVATSSTVYILDNLNQQAVDIVAFSGDFTLPVTTTTPITLITFDKTLYRSASIDIVAEDQTGNTFDSANGYTVLWNTTSTSVVGMSPVAVHSNGEVGNALWEIKDATISGSNIVVRLYNVDPDAIATHLYTWKAKVTLFRL